MAEGVRITTTLQPPAAPDAEAIRARDPVSIVIFGASGDLSHRKLLPALFHLHQSGYLPERYAVVGMARTPLSDGEFRAHMLGHFRERFPEDARGVSVEHPVMQALFYERGDASEAESCRRLKARLELLEKERHLTGNRLYYLAVMPELFLPILEHVAAAGMLYEKGARLYSRAIIEKPYGHDLSSARALNARVTRLLDESQIFRIDHFLGKETVQNIFAFRFGNAIFEPLFNQKYVDHVQITVAETQGMEGRRGAYYETAGALRDMVQNHMLQLLCLLAMEPPCTLDAQAIRDEKVKVLRSLAPFCCGTSAECAVRGQYGPGTQEGRPVKGYREEAGVRPDSQVETFVALRVGIDNWRWAGVPFLLRTGKRLRKRVSEIAMQFKQPPQRLFRELGGLSAPAAAQVNQLVFRIQPDEGIVLSFACKRPGLRLLLDRVYLDFLYDRAFRQRLPEAYERLLLDALRGDASLFTRSDEVDYSWNYVTDVLKGWQALPPPKFPNYEPFSDGPNEADRLLAGTEARWRPLAIAD